METTSPSTPRVAITLGDPTGVGPEITVKGLISPSLRALARIVIVGSPRALALACRSSQIDANIVEVSQPEDVPEYSPGDEKKLYIIPCGPNDWGDAIEPTVQAQGGEAAYQALVHATQLALANRVDAIVTSPLHKVALYRAGHDWPGHTELLAELCQVRDHAMMLYLPPGSPRHGGPAGLGVVHVTLHMALRDVFKHLSQEGIVEKIQLAERVFSRIRTSLGLAPTPRIAVTALNPHCGEEGRFGDEESTLISPAVHHAKRLGIDVQGPLAVDTLMPIAVDGAYDAVVAMYHDQGHIALKLLDMFDAVNITLGLPIVRTSVAHGTAHDIAWTNSAKASGMTQAILTAIRLQGIASE